MSGGAWFARIEGIRQDRKPENHAYNSGTIPLPALMVTLVVRRAVGGHEGRTVAHTLTVGTKISTFKLLNRIF